MKELLKNVVGQQIWEQRTENNQHRQDKEDDFAGNGQYSQAQFISSEQRCFPDLGCARVSPASCRILIKASEWFRHLLSFQTLEYIPRYFEEMGLGIRKSSEECWGIET